MKKNKQSSTMIKHTTVVFGYSLFALTILNVVISTVIPWVSIITKPHVLVFNASVFSIALVAGAILPVLLSYILGDRSTHVKNKASHHFNGVLFGVAAYWLSVLFTMFGPYSAPIVRENVSGVLGSTIVNGWPIIATTIIMAFVAVSYARGQKKKSSVLEHRPYQIVLLGGVVANFLYMPISELFGSLENLPLISIYAGAIIIFFAVSYVALSKSQPSRLMCTLLAVVAITMGFVAFTVAAQLLFGLFSADNFLTPMLISGVFGLIVWIGYLILISRRA
jgi:MFS family permease